MRRELAEEIGLHDFDIGPVFWELERTFPWNRRLMRQHNTIYLVRVHAHEPVPSVNLLDEGVSGFRWWTIDEMARTDERLTPPELVDRVRTILAS